MCVCEKYYEGDRQKLPHQVTEKHTNTGVRARLRRARPQRVRGGSPRQRRLWRRRSRKCGGDGRSEWRPCVEDNAADFFTKPMKNSDSFYKWRALIMNEPVRGDNGARIPRATDSEHQAAVHAPSQAAAVAASQVEPALLPGTLARGGASESESFAARALSEKQCNCISSVPCTVASRVPPGRNVQSVVQSSVCRI